MVLFILVPSLEAHSKIVISKLQHPTKVKYICVVHGGRTTGKKQSFYTIGTTFLSSAHPTDLGDILEAQKHAILLAVNSQIQNLQTNLLTAQAQLSLSVCLYSS